MDGIDPATSNQGGARKHEQISARATGTPSAATSATAATATATATSRGRQARNHTAKMLSMCRGHHQQQQQANHYKDPSVDVKVDFTNYCIDGNMSEGQPVLDAYDTSSSMRAATSVGAAHRTRSAASSPTAALEAAMREFHGEPSSAPPSPVLARTSPVNAHKSPVAYEEMMGREWTVCELGCEPCTVSPAPCFCSPSPSTLSPELHGCGPSSTAAARRHAASLYWSVHREPSKYDTDDDADDDCDEHSGIQGGMHGRPSAPPPSPAQAATQWQGQQQPHGLSSSSTRQPQTPDGASAIKHFLHHQRQQLQRKQQQQAEDQQQQAGEVQHMQKHGGSAQLRKREQTLAQPGSGATMVQMPFHSTLRHPPQKAQVSTRAAVTQQQQQQQQQQPLLPTPPPQCSQWSALNALQTMPPMPHLPCELATETPPLFPLPLQPPISMAPRRRQQPHQQLRPVHQPLIPMAPQQHHHQQQQHRQHPRPAPQQSMRGQQEPVRHQHYQRQPVQQRQSGPVPPSMGVATPPYAQRFVHVHHYHYVFVQSAPSLPSPLPPVLPQQPLRQGQQQPLQQGYSQRQPHAQQHPQVPQQRHLPSRR